MTVDLEKLARDVQILKDIEAIKRVKHAYFRCIDTANIDELRDLLDENITAKLVGGSYDIEFKGREEYLEMVANSFNSEFVGEHNGHHPEIDILSETEATGMWYLTDVAMDFRRGVTTIGSAIYRDKYQKQADGKWRIVHTAYERIYEMLQPITERPNLASHYLAKHGRKELTYTVTDVFQKA